MDQLAFWWKGWWTRWIYFCLTWNIQIFTLLFVLHLKLKNVIKLGDLLKMKWNDFSEHTSWTLTAISEVSAVFSFGVANPVSQCRGTFYSFRTLSKTPPEYVRWLQWLNYILPHQLLHIFPSHVQKLCQ